MEFQSAARFGERRVMVTDYDETAVEVNAKVLDEDTGEVICECESGGGGTSDFSVATITISSSEPGLYYVSLLDDIGVEGVGAVSIPTYIGQEVTESQIILYNGKSVITLFNLESPAVTITGSAEVVETEWGKMIVITGDSTIAIGTVG